MRIEPGGCQLDEDEAEVWIPLGSGAQQLRHEPSGGRADDPDPDGSGDFVGKRDHVRQQRVELCLHSPRAGDDDLACLGQLTGRTVDQLAAEFALELLDVRRDVRLHGLEGISGSGERAMIGDPHYCAQLAEFHRNQR